MMTLAAAKKSERIRSKEDTDQRSAYDLERSFNGSD